MRTPTIDELLEKVGSIYELTMLAAKEARRIRILDRDAKEPLQTALEHIADGKVKGEFLTNEEMEEFLEKESERTEAAHAMRDKILAHSTDVPPPK